MNDYSNSTVNYRVGEWLPSDQKILDKWLANLVETVEGSNKEFLPVIQEFQELIETDPEIYMFFNQMFSQVPYKPPYNRDPTHKPQVRNYHMMLKLINEILTRPPMFNETGLVGFPINAILDWPMGTEGGYAAFLNEKVNDMFYRVLNEWGVYLSSADSLIALSDNDKVGWLGGDAMIAMVSALPEYYNKKVTAEEAKEIFVDTFNCDPAKPYWGFTSWDDFFTRTFREGKRPVAEGDNVIANACESAPFNLVSNVQLVDKFWIKGQPYSLQHMLDNDLYTEEFAGGTVYQAFLSAKSYHKWNSPVSGTVVKTKIVPGTYYSEIPAEGFYNPLHPKAKSPQTPDAAAPNNSQGYLSEVATRGLIFIEADNPAIGLMCFIAIGMAEVSTCDITVYEGQHINKGDSIGMFHFGGSTHCLVFRPEVKLEFDLHGQTLDPDPTKNINTYNIAVCSKIATVVS